MICQCSIFQCETLLALRVTGNREKRMTSNHTKSPSAEKNNWKLDLKVDERPESSSQRGWCRA